MRIYIAKWFVFLFKAIQQRYLCYVFENIGVVPSVKAMPVTEQ